MKPLILLVAALVILPAFATQKPTRPQRGGTTTSVPSWLQKDLKPIVNKPVVTR